MIRPNIEINQSGVASVKKCPVVFRIAEIAEISGEQR